MSLEMWSQVRKFVDGDSLNAKTLNIPVGQLGDRTDYLYAKLRELISGDKLSSVVLTGVALSADEGEAPEAGNVVYLHQRDDEETFVASKAKATMSLYDDFTAADSAFTVGILQSRGKDATGNVIVYGRLDLAPDDSPISKDSMIEGGEEYRPGRYYLSANEAGKLTAHPNGPLIYVCAIGGNVGASGGFSGTAIVNPQYLDMGTSHTHRTAVLKARPAGELSEDGEHVLGYGTVMKGPFHLLFGGTWTADKTISYSFRIGVGDPSESCPSGFTLMWTEWIDGTSSSHEKPIISVGAPVSLTNGLTATLAVSGPGSSSSDPDFCDLGDDQKEWNALNFPDAGKGWVDHVSDENDEYPDALYDYVIGMDPQIANYWPPVPPKSAAIMVNGVEMDNAALFPDNPTVAFGKKTLHWFEDDEGRKPWPENIVLADLDPAYDKVMAMHWIRGFQGATGPVTSIQPKKGSPLKIYGYGTTDSANTGDLEIDAAIDFDIVDGGSPGFMVPKRSENGHLIAGPVVEKIVPGPGISIISSASGHRGQGIVQIGLDDGYYRNQFSDIALENAEQAKIGMFPYIRLKGYSGAAIPSPSAFTATMRVPINLPDMGYALRVSASVFGEDRFLNESAQRVACVKFSYNILPDFSAPEVLTYSNLKTSLLKPDAERTVYIPFGHQSDNDQGIEYNGFDPVFISTLDPDLIDKSDVVYGDALGKSIPQKSEFSGLDASPDLRPGYLVGIRMSRAVTPDSMGTPYRGAIGFINLSWEIVPADGALEDTGSLNGILDGVVIKTNTMEGMRTAVATIGGKLGAKVVR